MCSSVLYSSGVMDAKAVQTLNLPGLTRPEKFVTKTGCSFSRTAKQEKLRVTRRGIVLACSYNNVPGFAIN
jgi:hypothetical protein